MNPKIALEAMQRVIAERNRQDATWGDQAHHPDPVWLGILVNQLGKLSGVVMGARFGRSEATWDAAIDEATQTAAVSLAWLEALLVRRERGDEL